MGLTVEYKGECSGFPCEVTWPDPEDGEEYLYRFESMSISRDGNTPSYAYVPPDF